MSTAEKNASAAKFSVQLDETSETVHVDIEGKTSELSILIGAGIANMEGLTTEYMLDTFLTVVKESAMAVQEFKHKEKSWKQGRS